MKIHNPLVVVTIPTFNSEKTLNLCLKAVKQQTYRNIQIVIVDGGSTDHTRAIAKKYDVTKIINYPYALLGARFIGASFLKSDFTLLLDSDQILEKDTVQRAVNIAHKGFDIIILEEGVYRITNIIEWLFHYDRILSHAVKDFSPLTGVLLPRFFKTQVLLKAFSRIPNKLKESIGGQDHAIIYFETYKLTQKVAMVSHAVKHIEPSTFIHLWKKFYRWGYTSEGAHYGTYHGLLQKKERFRTGLFSKGMGLASLASITLLILKGVPFKLGYYVHVLQKKLRYAQ